MDDAIVKLFGVKVNQGRHLVAVILNDLSIEIKEKKCSM